MGTAPLQEVPHVDEDLRMGSEYASARSYLGQSPRAKVTAMPKRKASVEHGTNDSDFGQMDQTPD